MILAINAQSISRKISIQNKKKNHFYEYYVFSLSTLFFLKRYKWKESEAVCSSQVVTHSHTTYVCDQEWLDDHRANDESSV